MKKYYPILLSKSCELAALSHLGDEVKQETSPVIDVLANDITNVEATLLEHWSFEHNAILLDFTLFKNANYANLKIFFRRLFEAGVNAIPVVQGNSPERYLEFVRDLIKEHKCKICIRASNRGGGFNNYNVKITNFLTQLNTDRFNTLLLLDLGYAQRHNHHILSALAINLLERLPYLTNWAEIIVASGSFPEDLGNLPANCINHLDRIEWNIWSAVHNIEDFSTIKYGDYGSENPEYDEVKYSGGFSIKYSTKNNFIVYVSEKSLKQPDKEVQGFSLANKLIRNSNFYGNDFSWGDAELFRISQASMTISPKKKEKIAIPWGQISQNHHITLIHALL